MISGAGTEYLGKPLPEGWQVKMEAITENNIRIIGGPMDGEGNILKEIWVLVQGYSIMQQEDGAADHIKKAFAIMSQFFPDRGWPKTRFRYNTWYPASFVLDELDGGVQDRSFSDWYQSVMYKTGLNGGIINGDS